MASAGIQELAGHTTLAVTLRYMHLAPGVLKDAISLLGNGWATTQGVAEGQ
jgi:hypothetical protein